MTYRIREVDGFDDDAETIHALHALTSISPPIDPGTDLKDGKRTESLH
jgi:hypothetical protein